MKFVDTISPAKRSPERTSERGTQKGSVTLDTLRDKRSRERSVGSLLTFRSAVACRGALDLFSFPRATATRSLETRKRRIRLGRTLQRLLATAPGLLAGRGSRTLAQPFGRTVRTQRIFAQLDSVRLGRPGRLRHYAAAETQLQEALKDFAEIQPQHETQINPVAVLHQQNKKAAAAVIDALMGTTTPTSTSIAFQEGLQRVTTAFDREAVKYTRFKKKI